MFVVIILDTSNKHIYVEKNNIYFLKVEKFHYPLNINKTYRFGIPYMLKLLCTVLVLFGSRGKQDA